MKVMIRQHRKRRGAANAADTISSSSSSHSLRQEKRKRNKNHACRPRRCARSFLRAGNFGELKLQGCARGARASFFTEAAHDLTGLRDVTLKDRKPQAVIELVPGARASGVFPSR